MKKRILLNPFFIYAVVWTMTILVYNLRWSSLCLPIPAGVYIFFITTIIISLFFAIYTQRLNLFSYQPLPKINLKVIKQIMCFLYFLVLIEFIAAGGIPIIGYFKGDVSIEYNELGLPITHILIINGFSFLSLFLFHHFLSVERKRKKKILFYVLLSVIPFFLVFNRGMLMSSFLGFFLLYMVHDKLKLRSKLLLLAAGITTLLAFGLLGNVRTDTGDSKNVILEIGEATQKFQDAELPPTLFWSYLYVTTPFANLVYNVENTPVDYSFKNYASLVVNEQIPTSIAKRLPLYDIKRAQQVKPSFTAIGVYTDSYVFFGWTGMILMFLHMFVFITLSLLFVPKTSPYFVVTLVLINLIVFFNLFSNMFVYAAYIPQLVFSALLSIKYFVRRVSKKNLTN